MQKGFAKSFWTVSYGLAAVIIGLVIAGVLTGNLWTIGGSTNEAVLQTTAYRTGQQATTVASTPNTEAVLSFQKPLSISITPETISATDEDGNSGSISFTFTQPHIETANIDSTTSLCITNNGQFDAGQSCEIEECEEDACSMQETHGRYCSGGAWTTDRFYSHYHTSDADGCDLKDGPFVAIDRFTCPDQAETGSEYSCSFQLSHRCPEDKTISYYLTAQGTSYDGDISCTGSLEQVTRTHSFTLEQAGRGTTNVAPILEVRTDQPGIDTKQAAEGVEAYR